MAISRQTLAMTLSVIGILFFIARAMVWNSEVATFLGVAFMMLAGLTWAFWKKSAS